MGKVYFENKYCTITLNNKGEYEVVLKKDRANIRSVQIFKRDSIKEHYYYYIKYDPDLKWYFVVPVLLALFILPMVWVDLLENSFDSASYWKVFEMVSAIVTFTSFALLLLYIFIEKLFGVRFVSILLIFFLRRKAHGYVIKTKKDKKGDIDIPLECRKEQFKLVESLKLT